MHLLRTHPLVQELALGEVDPQEQAGYVLAGLVVWILASYSGLIVAGSPAWTLPSILEATALLAISVIGVVRCLDAAGGRQNQRFLVEFTCLSVPITVSTLSVAWGVYWIATVAFRDGLIALSRS